MIFVSSGIEVKLSSAASLDEALSLQAAMDASSVRSVDRQPFYFDGNTGNISPDPRWREKFWRDLWGGGAEDAAAFYVSAYIPQKNNFDVDEVYIGEATDSLSMLLNGRRMLWHREISDSGDGGYLCEYIIASRRGINNFTEYMKRIKHSRAHYRDFTQADKMYQISPEISFEEAAPELRRESFQRAVCRELVRHVEDGRQWIPEEKKKWSEWSERQNRMMAAEFHRMRNAGR